MKNEGFFKKSPKKVNKEEMNLSTNKKNIKKSNLNDESFDKIGFQEENFIEPKQVEQNIEIIEDIDQPKIAEINENKITKVVSQQKEKKKKK